MRGDGRCTGVTEGKMRRMSSEARFTDVGAQPGSYAAGSASQLISHLIPNGSRTTP